MDSWLRWGGTALFEQCVESTTSEPLSHFSELEFGLLRRRNRMGSGRRGNNHIVNKSTLIFWYSTVKFAISLPVDCEQWLGRGMFYRWLWDRHRPTRGSTVEWYIIHPGNSPGTSLRLVLSIVD